MMTKDGGHRVANADGAMLSDPAILGNLPAEVAPAALFDPSFWAARGESTAVSRGRGSAWFISWRSSQWALKHYRRGGLIASLADDRYIWSGEARVRAFAEWRLLAELTARALPVPAPVAARYQRNGLMYRCDLITQRIVDADPLSARMSAGVLHEGVWHEIGRTVARLHAVGVDHADLNAHNILLDRSGSVSVIDFDRGRIRPRGSWANANLARLHRSLLKLSHGAPNVRFSAAEWGHLIEGYTRAAAL